MLTACPSAVKILLAKTLILESTNSASLNVELDHAHTHRVLSSASVTFTPEFVKHYFGWSIFIIEKLIILDIYLINLLCITG
jgi:hypothetical protein